MPFGAILKRPNQAINLPHKKSFKIKYEINPDILESGKKKKRQF